MKDILQKLSQIEAGNKIINENISVGQKPVPVLNQQNQKSGMGVVTSNNPAVQNMLKGLNPTDLQVVMSDDNTSNTNIQPQAPNTNMNEDDLDEGKLAKLAGLAGAAAMGAVGASALKDRSSGSDYYDPNVEYSRTDDGGIIRKSNKIFNNMKDMLSPKAAYDRDGNVVGYQDDAVYEDEHEATFLPNTTRQPKSKHLPYHAGNKPPKASFVNKNVKEAELPSASGVDTRGAALGAGRSQTTLEQKWSNQLNQLLNEGLAVNVTKGMQGSPNVVNIVGTDADADLLLDLIKNAGLGLFNGETDTTKTDSIGVVADNDSMMSALRQIEDAPEKTVEEKCNECGGMLHEGDCVTETETEDQMEFKVNESTNSNVRKQVDKDGNVFYVNDKGQYHRDDGPAIIYRDGFKVWCQNGKEHRDNGPAVEVPDGTKAWLKHGQYHREDGAAIERRNGKNEYWIDGVRYSESAFKKKLGQIAEDQMESKVNDNYSIRKRIDKDGYVVGVDNNGNILGRIHPEPPIVLSDGSVVFRKNGKNYRTVVKDGKIKYWVDGVRTPSMDEIVDTTTPRYID